MTILLEVAYEAPHGAKVSVCGSEPSLGAWEVTGAASLGSSESSPSTWVGEIAIPTASSEFKLVAVQADGSVEWEPIPGNRAFPARALQEGCKLTLTWGQPSIGIVLSAAEIEANARKVRSKEDRVGSALQENVDRKGENAYYFAHNRNYEVPEDAKVITGPGLITGGAPVLIEAGPSMDTEDHKVKWLKDYSWSDSKGKVKVYIPIPEGSLPSDGADSLVSAEFGTSTLQVMIQAKPRLGVKIEKLNGELNVDACTTRVEAHKNRIVVQLAKKRDTTWYNLTKGG